MIPSAPQSMMDANPLPANGAAANANNLRSISVDSIPEKISLLRKCLLASPEYLQARLALSSLLMQENNWEAARRELKQVISMQKLKLEAYGQLRVTCTFNFALCLYHLEKYNASLHVLEGRRDADSMQLKAACNFRRGNLLVASDTFCARETINTHTYQTPQGFSSSERPSMKDAASKGESTRSGYATLVRPVKRKAFQSLATFDEGMRAPINASRSVEEEMQEAQLRRLEEMLERGEYEQCKHITRIPGIGDRYLDGARLLRFEPLNVLPAGLLLRGRAIEVSRKASSQKLSTQNIGVRDADEAARKRKKKRSVPGLWMDGRQSFCNDDEFQSPNTGEDNMVSEQQHYYPGDMLKSRSNFWPMSQSSGALLLLKDHDEKTKEALDPRANVLRQLLSFGAKDSRVSCNDITEAVDKLEVETFEYNSIVIAKGKQPSSKQCGMYILWKGSAKITLDDDLKLSTLQKGCCCGVGLIRDPLTIPKANCIVDSAEATFLKLPKVAFKQLLEKRPQLYSRLRDLDDPVTPSDKEIEALVQYHRSWQKYRTEVLEQEELL